MAEGALLQGLTDKQQKLAERVRRNENRIKNLQKEYDAIHVCPPPPTPPPFPPSPPPHLHLSPRLLPGLLLLLHSCRKLPQRGQLWLRALLRCCFRLLACLALSAS